MNSFAGNVQSPPATNPLQNQSAQGIVGSMPDVQGWQNLGWNALPYAQNTFNQSLVNPFTDQAMQGAQGAANLGQNVAGGLYGIGSTLAGQTLGGTLPYAGQVAQTAFDPQQQLYQRTLQQVQDQNRAGEAARGIGMTPYGAGLENQATQNFNIDWQNQQLGRQATGADALSRLYGTALAGGAGGAGLMSQAPGMLYGSAQLPYQTYGGFGQDQTRALMNFLGFAGAGQGLSNVGAQDWIAALNAGTNQQNAINQNFANQLKQSQLGWGQLGQLGQGIGSLFGGSGGLFSGSKSPFYSELPAGQLGGSAFAI